METMEVETAEVETMEEELVEGGEGVVFPTRTAV